MGVDTKLFISHRWNVSDIRDVLQKFSEHKIKTEFHDFAPDYVTLNFTTRAGNDRLLHIFTDTQIGGIKSIGMHMHADLESQMILMALAETFGGMYQPKDNVEQFEAYQPTSEGNIDFIVNEALKHSPKLGHDYKGMAEFLSKEKWK